MLYLDADAIKSSLSFAKLIEALRLGFSRPCTVPLRSSHQIDADGSFLLMPAWRAGEFFGVKTVTIFPKNSRRFAKPSVHAVYTLFDARSGEPLAVMDGSEITSRRTAAASALAADFLSPSDAKTLLVVGAGQVATLLPEAMRTVRPTLEKVLLWNRNPHSAEFLQAKLKKQDFNATCIQDLATAVGQADIISCATLATNPLIMSSWLRPGIHLDLIGSFTPAMSEAEPDCFKRSQVFTDTDEALTKSGDLLNAIAAHAFDPKQDHRGTLSDLCSGKVSGRASMDEITLFKSVGTALEDLAAAELAYASCLNS